MSSNSNGHTMKTFFSSLDKEVITDPKALALRFASSFWNAGRRHYEQKLVLPSVDNLWNVSILARDTSLEFLTKRIPLVASTTVVTHSGERPHLFWEYRDSPPAIGADRQDTACYLRCPDLVELGTWLRDCQPLLEAGDIYYFPDVLIERITETHYYQVDQKSTEEASIALLCDVIVQSRRITDAVAPAALKVPQSSPGVPKTGLMRPILQVELPYIDNVDLATFSKISSDEHEALDRFRDYLRQKFLDLQEAQNDVLYETRLAKLILELRDGVRKLESDMKALRRKRAFQAAGAMVLSTTATLVAFNSNVLGSLPQLLGASGGLMAVSKILEEYLADRQRVKDNALYYLWLFHNPERL